MAVEVKPYTSGYYQRDRVVVESLRWVDEQLYVEIRKDSYGDYDWRAMIPFAQFVRGFEQDTSWGKQEVADEPSMALVVVVPPEKLEAVAEVLR